MRSGIRGGARGGSARLNLTISEVEYASSSMHVTCRVWGPVPSSSGDAEYSPRPDVRLKPGNGGMGEWGMGEWRNGIIKEWENGGMGVHEDDIGMVKVVRDIYQNVIRRNQELGMAD